MNWIKIVEKTNFDKLTLKRFGVTMSSVFLLITLIIFFKHKQANLFIAALSLGFLVTVFLNPVMLKPVYFLWMRLAFILGWLNSRLILIIIFYLVFTPIGIVLRLTGKDLLSIKIEKNKVSYWKKRETPKSALEGYERQF
ncbi:MAG: hypothetical protein FJZ11_01740 [Candidatus Omnitrophica bacterium]|nr:hypothetical protein [Candidatus Omnitrophota bacterium]